MTSTPVKIIFGAGGFGRHGKDGTAQFLEMLEKYNIKELDTAALYVSDAEVPETARSSAVAANGSVQGADMSCILAG